LPKKQRLSLPSSKHRPLAQGSAFVNSSSDPTPSSRTRRPSDSSQTARDASHSLSATAPFNEGSLLSPANVSFSPLSSQLFPSPPSIKTLSCSSRRLILLYFKNRSSSPAGHIFPYPASGLSPPNVLPSKFRLSAHLLLFYPDRTCCAFLTLPGLLFFAPVFSVSSPPIAPKRAVNDYSLSPVSLSHHPPPAWRRPQPFPFSQHSGSPFVRYTLVFPLSPLLINSLAVFPLPFFMSNLSANSKLSIPFQDPLEETKDGVSAGLALLRFPDNRNRPPRRQLLSLGHRGRSALLSPPPTPRDKYQSGNYNLSLFCGTLLSIRTRKFTAVNLGYPFFCTTFPFLNSASG